MLGGEFRTTCLRTSLSWLRADSSPRQSCFGRWGGSVLTDPTFGSS